MAETLPRLRNDIELLPAESADGAVVLLRDPYRYSNAELMMSPLLARCLGCFDGEQTAADLQALLYRMTGRLDSSDTSGRLIRALGEGGFLEDDAFHALRDRRHREFAVAAVRDAVYAGGGYPETAHEIHETLMGWLGRSPRPLGPPPPSSSPAAAKRPAHAKSPGGELVAIAAPHVSPIGAPATYGAAYRALATDAGAGADGDLAERTFVILGTSHYGRPNHLGVTRKPFRTPLGEARTDAALVHELASAAPSAVQSEDYCHTIEHSIEFQVVFLQHVFGPSVRILPILCGALLARGRPGHGLERPEKTDGELARAYDALASLHAKRGRELVWVLGVDMAHVGRRYGDDEAVRAHEGTMLDVTARDRARLDSISNGDADGFWNLVHERGEDDLKWCGTAPIYTFLRTIPEARGELVDYDHWNIDDASVVSFAAMTFRRG